MLSSALARSCRTTGTASPSAAPTMSHRSRPRINSEWHAAAQHVGEQAEVADQAVKRVPERRGAVALHREMAEPREPVAEQRQQPEKDPALGREHAAQGEKHKQRAREVQAPRAAAAVLGQVVRIELAERGVLHALMLRLSASSSSSLPLPACSPG